MSARGPARSIADAILYEGYILWPYRRAALKNQRRFTFGGVYPHGHSETHADDPSVMRTEVLLEATPDTRLEVTVRFLQIVDRSVARCSGTGLEKVDELTVGHERFMTWEEAVEREVSASGLSVQELDTGCRIPIAVPAGCEQDDLLDAGAEQAGALLRSWHVLEGEVLVGCAEVEADVFRLGIEVHNRTPFSPGSGEEARAHTFCSTHALLHAREGAFVSLTAPPESLRGAAQGCRNEGAWPVLMGEPGSRTTMLCSPILLEDHPRIAPESWGDPFEGGEIDQLLILNIPSLTTEEKDEIRAADPHAREILERTAALTPDELMRLHGTIGESGLER